MDQPVKIVQPYSWADEEDLSCVESVYVNEIPPDPEKKFLEVQDLRILEYTGIKPDNTKKPDILTIVDKPENLNNKFIDEESRYHNQIYNPEHPKKEESWHVQKSRKNKCYTCYPRKKVTDHIIYSNNTITFHHDMCDRNIIVVTPSKHYQTLENQMETGIGQIFKEIDKFCRNWNITDYSVSYNQGEWQHHEHFHIKIKTIEAVVKRMKGDHFRLLKLQKEYPK